MKTLHPVSLPPGLYLVSTPIGNLRDMTLRALDVLTAVDTIICEDTRVTAKLLQAHGIPNKPLLVLNDHSENKGRAAILSRLANGESMALVSDAGTPLVSDPGYKLVRDAQDLGIMVTSLPGANAPLTALQLSGLPNDAFCFIGFLPSKSVARKKEWQRWAHSPATLLAFETAPRLLDSLIDMRDVLGDRDAAVVREITKMFEESRRGTLSELIAHYTADGPPKGEIVLVVSGAPDNVEMDDAAIDDMIASALDSMRVKDAAAFVSEQTGRPKKEIYERALIVSKQGRDE